MNDGQDGLAEVIAFPGNNAASGDREGHLARLRARMLETEAEHAPEPYQNRSGDSEASEDASDPSEHSAPHVENLRGEATCGKNSWADRALDKPALDNPDANEPTTPGVWGAKPSSPVSAAHVEPREFIRGKSRTSAKRPQFVATSVDAEGAKRAETAKSTAPGNVSHMPGVSEHHEAETQDASDLLVRALGRSAKSVSEAESFLAERTELSARQRENVVNRMIDLGYLDDARLAEQLIEGALSRKGLGRGGMSRELRKRGLDDSDIQNALGDLDGDEEFDRALALAQERASRFRGLDYETAQRRLYGYLARRGFGGDIVGRAVKEALAEN